jgi:eukaryotic translation initiation factor 2C
MVVIPARELPPPHLSYGVGRANVSNGSWNILDVKFHRGNVVINRWLLVVRDGFSNIQGPQDPRVEALVEGFSAKCKKSGIAMPDGP